MSPIERIPGTRQRNRSKLIFVLAVILSCSMGSRVDAADHASKLLSAALESAKLIEDESDRADALETIVKLQAQCGDTDAAKSTIELITDAGRRSSAKVLIPMGRAKAGDIEGAKAMIEPNSPEIVREAVYEIIANAQATKGDLSAARATTAQIKQPFFKASADAEIAIAQVRAGDLEGGLKRARSNVAVGGMRTETYIRIAILQARKGDQAAARKTIALANESINEVPKTSLPHTLGILAFAKTTAKDPSPSPTAQEAMNPRAKSFINRNIAHAQLEMNDIKAAKTTASLLTSENDKIEFMAVLAEAQAKGNDKTAAGKTLDDAKTLLATISPPQVGVYGSYCIAVAQTRMGDENGAATWTRSLKDPLVRASTYCAIVEALLPSAIANPN
jgi:hypothetical protein